MVSAAGDRRLWGAGRDDGGVAVAQEFGHAFELLGRDHGGCAILACVWGWRRHVHGVVLAAAFDDGLSSQSRRPRGPHRPRRRLVLPPSRAPFPTDPRG